MVAHERLPKVLLHLHVSPLAKLHAFDVYLSRIAHIPDILSPDKDLFEPSNISEMWAILDRYIWMIVGRRGWGGRVYKELKTLAAGETSSKSLTSKHFSTTIEPERV
jgi:hypothetical protein